MFAIITGCQLGLLRYRVAQRLIAKSGSVSIMDLTFPTSLQFDDSARKLFLSQQK